MFRRIAPAILGLLVFAHSATAEEDHTGFNQTLDDRFQLLVGAYFADVHSSYQRVDGAIRSSREIDLEKLGLEKDETQLYLYGRIRFSKRWRLNLNYFGTDRSASEGAPFNIPLSGGTIPAGIKTRTKFKTKVYSARLGYSFVRTKRADLGAGLGLYVADLDLGIKANLNVGGGPGTNVTISQNTDVTAPLPTISVFGSYAFNDKVSIAGRAAYFTLDYDKYDGDMWDAMASIDYRAFKNLGIGAGYAYWKTDLDVDEGNDRERYEVRFKGPMLYVRAGF